jgi:phosphocarrier protein
MSEPQVTRTVTVANRHGLHLRAALLVLNTARRFDAKISLLTPERQRADATDVLQVMSLGAEPGCSLVLEATGKEAEAAVEALAKLFADRFHEDDA